jgi:hypothetical protein
LELINKSAYETRDLQYFISSGITLERGKGVQFDIELKDGEGRIKEINAHETIIIPKNTGGVLMPEAGPLGNPRTLRICFDYADEYTLAFRENLSDHRFYLVFREDRNYGEFTEYGTDSYKVDFKGAIPYLYVRLDAQIDDRAQIREVPGRYVEPRVPSPPDGERPPAPAAPAGDDGSSVREVPGRYVEPRVPSPPVPERPPVPAASDGEVPGRYAEPRVPAPPAPERPPVPAAPDNEGLDLGELLEL